MRIKTRIKISLFSFLIFLVFISQSQTVLSCGCPGDPTETTAQFALNRMKWSDAVFSGQVISISYRKMSPSEIAAFSERYSRSLDNKTEYQIETVKFKVYRWWKGYREKEITLLTDTFKFGEYGISNSCEAGFTLEHEYIVFAKGKDKFSLKTHACSGTMELNSNNKSSYLPSLGIGKLPKTHIFDIFR